MKDINTTERSIPFGFLDGDKVNYLVRIGDGNDTNYAVYTESLDGRSSPFLVPHDSYEETLATVWSAPNTTITEETIPIGSIGHPPQLPNTPCCVSPSTPIQQSSLALVVKPCEPPNATATPIVAQCEANPPRIGAKQDLITINGNANKTPQQAVIIEKEKNQVSSFDVSVAMIQKLPFAIVDKELYCFNGSYYSVVDSDDVNSLIMTLCQDEVQAKGYPRFVKDIQEFIRMRPELKLTTSVQNSFPQYLAFNNGVLNLQDWSFASHSPAIFLTYKVCTDYSPTANLDTPIFDRYLLQTFNGEPQLIERIWESLGYLLTNDHNGKVFFVLQGVGDSGKSMLIHFIESLFPESLICPAQLSDFGERFGMSIMNGKKLCICADLPKKLINEQAAGMIKAMTGGDIIACEGKYEAKKTFKNTAKLICATNHPVTLASKDEAFMRRMIIIPFMYSIPKEQQDHMLIEKLKAEKQAIVIKALQAYCRLRDRNYVFSGDNLVNALRLNAVPVVISTESLIEEFVNLHCKFVSEEQFTSTDDLCAAYNQFTSQRDLPLMDKTDFSKRLKDKYSPRITDDRVTVSGKKVRGYRGIILAVAQTEAADRQ